MSRKVGGGPPLGGKADLQHEQRFLNCSLSNMDTSPFRLSIYHSVAPQDARRLSNTALFLPPHDTLGGGGCVYVQECVHGDGSACTHVCW